MENRLEFIEQILSRFFERFTGAENEWKRDLLSQILHQMAMNAIPHEDGYSILPDLIKVYVSPEDETKIPEIQRFVHNNMNDLMVQLYAENMVPQNDPLVTFSTDFHLDPHRISVVTVSPENEFDITDTLPIVPELSSNATFVSKAYLLYSDGREYLMDQPIINIGRNAENHLVLDFPTISRHHAQIRLTNGLHHIFDIQSTSGTYINEVRIEHGILNSGDVIKFADIQFIYITEVSQSSERPVSSEDTQEIF